MDLQGAHSRPRAPFISISSATPRTQADGDSPDGPPHQTPNEKLAWLIIQRAPTGILGLLLEHPVRVALAKPTAAAIFLMVNGVILIAAERLRRRGDPRWRAARRRPDPSEGRELTTLSYKEAGGIGLAQSTALIAGISRDGICMTTGLLRGLNNEDAARFAFLL